MHKLRCSNPEKVLGGQLYATHCYVITVRVEAFDLRKAICTSPSFLEMGFLMGENMGQRFAKPKDGLEVE